MALHPSMWLPGNFFFSPLLRTSAMSDSRTPFRTKRQRRETSGGMSGGLELTGAQTQSDITAWKQKRSDPERVRKGRHSPG